MDREYDSNANLDNLLDRVERGEDVVISRGGTPVAKLTRLPAKPGSPEAFEAARRLANFRKEHNVGTMTLDEVLALRHEGHKY